MRMLSSGPPPPPPPPAQETEVPAPVLASFPLTCVTRDQIDGVKDAAAEAGTQQRPSSFVAASALVWVCLLRSRSVGVDGAARSHMLFPAECRSRLAPPLPAEYFGNCLRPCFVEAATSELTNGDGGVDTSVKDHTHELLQERLVMGFEPNLSTLQSYRVVCLQPTIASERELTWSRAWHHPGKSFPTSSF